MEFDWKHVTKHDTVDLPLLDAAYAALADVENESSQDEFGANIVHGLDSLFLDGAGHYVVFVDMGLRGDTSPVGYSLMQAWSGATQVYMLRRI